MLRNPAHPDVELRLLVEATHQRPPPSGLLAQEQDAFDRGAAHAEQFHVYCLVRQLFREIASLEDRGTLRLAGCATATPA